MHQIKFRADLSWKQSSVGANKTNVTFITPRYLTILSIDIIVQSKYGTFIRDCQNQFEN
jgi:hypothetical protein